MNGMNDWSVVKAEGRLVAAAVHDGHSIRENLVERLSLDDASRLREEDPFTGIWTGVGNSTIVVSTSRFEVDLNRPREKAVYRKPEDAWGLSVWNGELEDEFVNQSLEKYDRFYEDVKVLFAELEKEYGTFFVYDIHTYNHMRDGESGSPADPESNPEVNIGTGNLDRERWASLVDRFISDLSSFDYNGRHLDVRENVKFKGGEFSRWIGNNFPDSACCIAIEFKKFFMDEWTGIPDEVQVALINDAVKSTAEGVLDELNKAGVRNE